MATCYNCDTLPSYDSTLSNCSNYRTAGTNNIILLHCGYEISDPADGEEWLDLIDQGGATWLSNFKAGITPPSPVTQDSIIACGSTVTINNDWTVTITDYKVNVTNNDFWGVLTGGYLVAGMLMDICPTEDLEDISLWVDAQVSFGGGINSPDNNGELISNQITATFRKKRIETVLAPVGIWD